MAVCHHLAMTAAEISASSQLPEHLAYMACHFSAYGTGLSNMPTQLPKDSLLILNDRVPICGHDHTLVAAQLRQLVQSLKCNALLLDFQRPGYPELSALAQRIAADPPCPVAVSSLYAKDLPCAVFLPPVPLHKTITDHIAPWQGRAIWLEAAIDAACITVTGQGSEITSTPYTEPPPDALVDSALHCSYEIELAQDAVLFHLFRTRTQLESLLEEAKALGVSKTIGLYQQFRRA